MYRFDRCVNRFCPYTGLAGSARCPCEGTGYVMSGTSSEPQQARRFRGPRSVKREKA